MVANASAAAAGDGVQKAPLRRRAIPYLLSVPALLLTVGVLIPFFTAVIYSLQRYNLAMPQFRQFIWFQNYIDLLTSADFWHTVQVTVVYTVASMGTELVLGLVIALLLEKRTKINDTMSVLLMLPLMVAPAIASVIWKLMTNTNFGIFNHLLGAIGVEGFGWANDPATAMFTVVLVDVWVFTPFYSVLLLSGLRGLPSGPFEAARLDGVPRSFVFFRITLPMLMPFIITASLFRLFETIQMFDIPYAMTQGGPGDALMLFQVAAYLEAFTYTNLGRSAAILVILWAITFFLSNLMIKKWLAIRERYG